MVSACVCVCVHMHVRIYTRVPLSTRRSKVDTGVFLHHSLSHSGRVSQPTPELADMTNLTAYRGRNYRCAATSAKHFCELWGPELLSSCLSGKLFNCGANPSAHMMAVLLASHRNELLSLSVKDFPNGVHCSGKTHLECGRHSTGPELSKNQKGPEQ